MKPFQELWWKQARSDYQVFIRFRDIGGFEPCHALHYLQMATEKISKAYSWRDDTPPKMSHTGFRMFLKLLTKNNRQESRNRLASIFGFSRFSDFEGRIKAAFEVAYELERLAPALAGDGPNPEYPWPHAAPQFAPMAYEFPVWKALTTSKGRELMKFLKSAVEQFPEYAHL